jgi:hypothetical protein
MVEASDERVAPLFACDVVLGELACSVGVRVGSLGELACSVTVRTGALGEPVRSVPVPRRSKGIRAP